MERGPAIKVSFCIIAKRRMRVKELPRTGIFLKPENESFADPSRRGAFQRVPSKMGEGLRRKRDNEGNLGFLKVLSLRTD